MNLVSVSICVILALLASSGLQAQDQYRQRYDESLAKWRGVYVEALKVWSEFRICEEHQAEGLRVRYLELKDKGDTLVDQTIMAAADCVENSITPDPKLIQFLSRVPLKYFEDCRYGDSTRVGRALLKHDPDDFALLYNTSRSAFFDNQFEYAGELFDRLITLEGQLRPQLQPLYDIHKNLIADWQTEQGVREQEALTNQLPRIAFELEKGSVIVELFEDQFPLVVNNLIWLIERDQPFFVDQAFFFVLKHQLAVTGSSTDDGKEVIPVTYATSAQQEVARQIFRGSVGLDVRKISATQTVISTGLRFFQIPIPEMSDTSLVIGRVVEGMELIDGLQATHQLTNEQQVVAVEEAIPDRVIRVTVNRKPEGKEYKYIDVQALQNPDPAADPNNN